MCRVHETDLRGHGIHPQQEHNSSRHEGWPRKCNVNSLPTWKMFSLFQPENILCLTKTGNRIKIIDFGFARRYDPNKKLHVNCHLIYCWSESVTILTKVNFHYCAGHVRHGRVYRPGGPELWRNLLLHGHVEFRCYLLRSVSFGREFVKVESMSIIPSSLGWNLLIHSA